MAKSKPMMRLVSKIANRSPTLDSSASISSSAEDEVLSVREFIGEFIGDEVTKNI